MGALSDLMKGKTSVQPQKKIGGLKGLLEQSKKKPVKPTQPIQPALPAPVTEYKKATLPRDLGGGSYYIQPGEPNKLIKPEATKTYGSLKPKTGQERDHFIAQSLGGASDDYNLNYVPAEVNQAWAKIESKNLNAYKRGEISLPQARLNVLKEKQEWLLKQKGISQSVKDNLVYVAKDPINPVNTLKAVLKRVTNPLSLVKEYAKAILPNKVAELEAQAQQAKKPDISSMRFEVGAGMSNVEKVLPGPRLSTLEAVKQGAKIEPVQAGEAPQISPVRQAQQVVRKPDLSPQKPSAIDKLLSGIKLSYDTNPFMPSRSNPLQSNFEVALEPAEKKIFEKTLNTDLGKKVITKISESTEDIPLKLLSGIEAAGTSKTYGEVYSGWKKAKENPDNPLWKKFIYDFQSSAPQSLLGVAMSFVPYAGKPLAYAYWSALSAGEQIQDKGEVTSAQNIAIDTIGDSLLGGSLEGLFKKPAKTLISTLKKSFLTEGGTESAQTLLKYANDYRTAKNETDRNQAISNAKQYITSGAILMEFSIGGLSGASIGGLGFAANKTIGQQPGLSMPDKPTEPTGLQFSGQELLQPKVKAIPSPKVVSAGKVVIPKAQIKPQKAQGDVLPTKTTKVSSEVKPSVVEPSAKQGDNLPKFVNEIEVKKTDTNNFIEEQTKIINNLTDEQKSDYLSFKKDAYDDFPNFKDRFDGLTEEMNLTVLKPVIKSDARAIEKAIKDDGGVFSVKKDDNGRLLGIKDMVRAAIIENDYKKMAEVVEKIKDKFNVIRVKNRLDSPSYGYRDVLINVMLPNGTVGEIQIMTPAMSSAKKINHILYEESRAPIDYNKPLLPQEIKKTKLKILQIRNYEEANLDNILRYQRDRKYTLGIDKLKKVKYTTIADEAYSKTLENGGVTISLKGKQPTTGYSYSPYKGLEVKIAKSEFTNRDYLDFLKKNHLLLSRPGHYIGGWEDDGFIYIDVSKVGKPEPRTIEEAQKNNQLAVFDLESLARGNDGTINIGTIGDDGKYTVIDSPDNLNNKYKQSYEKTNVSNINRGKDSGGDGERGVVSNGNLPENIGKTKPEGEKGEKGLKQSLPKKPKPSIEPLIEEAKKYKSAEDFVKAQGTINPDNIEYHGTGKSFDRFVLGEEGSSGAGTENLGVFTTKSKNAAKFWAEKSAGVGKDGNVVKVYLDIKNPKVFKSQEALDNFLGDNPEQAIEMLKKQGFDAIKYPESGIDKFPFDYWDELASKGVEFKNKLPDEPYMTTQVFDPKKVYILGKDGIAGIKNKIGNPLGEYPVLANSKISDIQKINRLDDYSLTSKEWKLSVHIENYANKNDLKFNDAKQEIIDAIKTKSQLTEIWNKANKSTLPKPKKQPIKYVPVEKPVDLRKKITTESIVAKPSLPQRIKAESIKSGLEDAFGDIEYYNKVSVKSQAEETAKLINEDYDRAIRIAMGQENAPGDLLPESVLIGVKNQAIKSGDIELLINLATAEGGVARESTVLGQRIKMLDEGLEDDAFRNIKKVVSERRNNYQKKTGKSVDKAIKQETDKIKEDIKKTAPKKDDWLDFVNSITC